MSKPTGKGRYPHSFVGTPRCGGSLGEILPRAPATSRWVDENGNLWAAFTGQNINDMFWVEWGPQ